MPQNKSFSLVLRLLVVAGYAGLCALLIGSVWGGIFFAFGVVCAVGLLIGDEVYFQHWYVEKGEPPFLVTRSPLFMLAMVPFSVLVFLTFGNVWASGLMGGLLLFLLLEMIASRADRRVIIAGGVFLILLHLIVMK